MRQVCFYNLSLRHRFIRLYEIILMHQPSFYIDDEFYVRLKYLKRVNSALTLNLKSYNEYNNSDTKIDFSTVKNINFVEIATSKDQILTRKLRIPLFDGYTFYCEDEKNPSSCISGYYDFNGRSKEFIDNVIAQKKEIENDPLLKSIYDRENNEKLKSLLDFYLGIVVLPFLVNE